MVFFAISHTAFVSYVELNSSKYPLWVCAGVLSKDKLASLRSTGYDVTDFDYTLEPNDLEGIEAAIDTIREHHPGHTVWVAH